jgi:hypothetical protein
MFPSALLALGYLERKFSFGDGKVGTKTAMLKEIIG